MFSLNYLNSKCCSDKCFRIDFVSNVFDLVQNQKTRIVNNDLNPVWDEELNLSIQDCSLPIKLVSS